MGATPKHPAVSIGGQGLWLGRPLEPGSDIQTPDLEHLDYRVYTDPDTVDGYYLHIGEDGYLLQWSPTDIWDGAGIEVGGYYGYFQVSPPADATNVSWRHAFPTSYMNIKGQACAGAVRIPVGDQGYRDPLPGLYRVVVDSVDSTSETATVHLAQADNLFDYEYSAASDGLLKNYLCFSYYDFYNPIIDGESVVVDYSSGNSNKHLIPGVEITMGDFLLAGDECVIGCGYEYRPQTVHAGGGGSYYFYGAFWEPVTSMGFRTPSEDICQPVDAVQTFRDYISGPPDPDYIYYLLSCFNVTGAVQAGCKIRVFPLIVMDQGHTLRPFASFFIAYDNEGDVYTELGNTLYVTFSNTGGSPKTTDMSVTGGFDLHIDEVDSTTFVDTGTSHVSAQGLKCDGTTLYRWNEMCAYFVLSADLEDTDSASIDIREGFSSWQPYGDNVTGYTKSVGTWLIGQDTFWLSYTWELIYQSPGSWQTYTIRNVIPAEILAESGDTIRVTLHGHPTGAMAVDNVAIVERDTDTPNGTTTPTEILFGGTSGVAVAADTEETSDWTTFNYDRNKEYLLILDMGSASSQMRYKSTSTCYWLVGSDSYNVQDMPGAGDPPTYTEESKIYGLRGFDLQVEGRFPGPLGYDQDVRNGKLQAQGHEIEITSGTLGNYDDGKYWNWFDITGIGLSGSNLAGVSQYDDNPYGVMILLCCDDPRYFQCVPVTLNYRSEGGEYEWRAQQPNTDYDSDADYFSKKWPVFSPVSSVSATMGRYLVGVMEESTESAYYSMLIHDIDADFFLRIHQVPSAMISELSDLGIEVEP